MKVIHSDGVTVLESGIRNMEYSGDVLIVNMKNGMRRTFKHGNLV